jgi:hypothetical protein
MITKEEIESLGFKGIVLENGINGLSFEKKLNNSYEIFLNVVDELFLIQLVHRSAYTDRLGRGEHLHTCPIIDRIQLLDIEELKFIIKRSARIKDDFNF